MKNYSFNEFNMCNLFKFFTVIFLINHKNAFAEENTSTLPTCKIKSSHFNECLKTYLQEAIRHSSEGSLQYSIPPLDPFFLPRISMTSNKIMGVNIEMRNSSIYGFSKAILTKIKSDPAKGIFEIHYLIPASTSISNYILKGKVFNMPINGSGKSNITLYDVHYEVKVQGHIVDNYETGNKQFVLNTVTMRMKPKNMKFQFDKLFQENKDLGDMMNQMMNDNWQDIFAKLQPKMEDDMSKHTFILLNNFFKVTPYDKIFPDL